MEHPEETLAARLAGVRGQLDHPPGVVLGVLRLPILDPLIGELEALVAGTPTDGRLTLPTGLRAEIERTVELLATGMHGTAPESAGRRSRLVEVLRRADAGELPAIAFDHADAFGAELRAMLDTDRSLRLALGHLHPLLLRATTQTPPARWVVEARALLATVPDGDLGEPIRRTLSTLVRAKVESRPDLLIGALRPANQRLARGLSWFASIALDAPAELLGSIGVRMGTSGRNDAVVRDTAVANTCAALLGASDDPAAPAALATMRLRVTNRVVLKAVDRALAELAARSGSEVADVVELALPGFGLDQAGRLSLPAGPATALIEVASDGSVHQRWRLADQSERSRPPASLGATYPAEVAAASALVTEIRSALAEERRRMEERMASGRTWSELAWQVRFPDHPIRRHFGLRLLWRVGPPGEPGETALPDAGGWLTSDGRHLPAEPGRVVSLWHPAQAPEAEILAWRATLGARAVEQPVKQIYREVFRVLPGDLKLAADRRFAGRVVSHGHLRALLRDRGWAVPALGAWDQGDEATAFRTFDDGVRAELRYQALERVPTGARQERARLVAVRFVARTDPVRSGDPILVPLPNVTLRIFSESIRDVSLVVMVAESASSG